MSGPGCGVGQQGQWRVEVRDHRVLSSVVVPVQSSQSAADVVSLEVLSELFAFQCRELAAARVAVATRWHLKLLSLVDIPGDVSVGDHQVEVSIEIGVEEFGPPTDKREAVVIEPGLACAVQKLKEKL